MDVQREAMTESMESIEEHELAEMMEAATKMQTMFRGKCARKHLEEKRAAIAAKEKEAERLARMESTASMDQGVPSWDDAKPSLNARPSQRASNVSVITTAGVIAHDDGEELKVQMALAQLSAAYEQEVKYGEGLGLEQDAIREQMPEIDAFFDWFVECGTVPLMADRIKLYAEPVWLESEFAAFQAMTEEARAEAKARGHVAELLRDDATLDPMKELAGPHFHGRARLAVLLLPPAADPEAGPDIRLLSARKLIAHIDGGGKMATRQALEADGKDLYLDAKTVRELLPELETKDEHDRCTFSSVVAVSYARVTPADPDPAGAQLAQLRPVLVWWMCERAKRKLGWDTMGIDADATMKTADFGVFIDVMSLYQPDLDTDTSPTSVLDTAKLAYTHDTHKKPEEQASFDRAIHNVGLLYGHKNTAVLRLTQTPVPPVGDPDRVASRRGWTHLERRLGDLEESGLNSLDVANWPTALEERAARLFVCGNVLKPTAAQRGPPQMCETEEELAAYGDHDNSKYLGTLGALLRGGRGAPVSPGHFTGELMHKVFSVEADVKICEDLYRGVAEPLLAGMEALAYTKLEWTSADWRHMGGALGCCTKLRKLSLNEMGVTDAAMGRMWHEVVGGSEVRAPDAPALETLSLCGNEIGPEGVRHLAEALARGAAPALKKLELARNKIGDEGMPHLGDAFKRGATPKLEALDLTRNEITDKGLRHIGDALAKYGGVPNLKALDLDKLELRGASGRLVMVTEEVRGSSAVMSALSRSNVLGTDLPRKRSAADVEKIAMFKAQLELKAMQLKAVEPVKDDGEMKPTRRAGDKERDDIVAGRAFVPMGNQRHHNLNLP